jgi:hypothetical protein
VELSDEEIERLLSRGGLGREHKLQLLQRVLASVPTAATGRRRAPWRWRAVGVLSLSGALAVAALWGRPSGQASSTLRAKGTPAAVPIIAMSCLGGSLVACPTGSRIAFWVEGGPRLEGGREEPGFVTAYADSIARGERVWYLTNEALSAGTSPSTGSPRAVSRAALVGKDQPNGRYRVSVVLTRHPITRAELARLTPDVTVTRASFDLVVSP